MSNEKNEQIKEGCSERLKEFRLFKGMSTRELAKELGMSGSTISLIENGKRNPTIRFITSLCNKFPELNREWMISGTGEMVTFEREKEMALIASKVLGEGEVSEEILQLIEVLAMMSESELTAFTTFVKKYQEIEGKKKKSKKDLSE